MQLEGTSTTTMKKYHLDGIVSGRNEKMEKFTALTSTIPSGKSGNNLSIY